MLLLFDRFSLDMDSRELRMDGRLVAVEPKALDLIGFLIANRSRVVSKDELLAVVWNGRVISESAMTTCINAARTALDDSGARQRLIKTLPRKGLRFVGTVTEAQPTAEPHIAAHIALPQPPLELPEKPSIAVLPFTSLSHDPDQEYFADGVVDEIITALSRMRWLFVIARNSSFTFKGRAVDVKQVGRLLGVRYILEGSVRKSAKRVRISAQLVDAESAANLLAHRFDGTIEDIFELQDAITAGVVGAITAHLETAAIEKAKRKPTASLDAYDHYLRGMALAYRASREAHETALTHFYRATELDPQFAPAYGMAARAYAWRATNGWMTDITRETAETQRLIHTAVELGKDDALALGSSGMAVARILGDLDYGVRLIDRALALNPNLVSVWTSSGWVRAWLGDADTAIAHFERAIRLSPVDPQMFVIEAGVASAHFIAERIEDSATWAERALKGSVHYGPALRIATASHALTGRAADAAQTMARLQMADPALRLSNLRTRVPYRRNSDLKRLESGLRLAGVPE